MNRYDDYKPVMEEVHHVHKLDHPSGTAITLAEELVAQVDRLQGWAVGQLTQPDGTVEGSSQTAEDKLRIDSIRRGEVPGIHSISWDSDFDSITITHDAHSRRGFALGAVLAAEYTASHQGLLCMDDMLKF
jgi:4-hydroxy-tetrahydrodipicolinate reductase